MRRTELRWNCSVIWTSTVSLIRRNSIRDILTHCIVTAVLTDLEPDTRYSIAIDESKMGLFVRTAPEELIDRFEYVVHH